MKVKTIISDNQPVLIEGLKQVLCTDDRFEFLITACSQEVNWLELIQRHQPDLVILELKTPDADSIQVIRQLHKLSAQLRICVFTRFEQSSLPPQVSKAGAHGLLLKTASLEEVKVGIAQIMTDQVYFPQATEKARAHSDESSNMGEPLLTKREVQILQLISKAMSNKQIASQLFISYQTVSVHRKNIMRKLGVSNTAGLVRAAYDHCLV
jgi:two-component system NarL family response regulator